MTSRLEGKTALITGATTGLGFETAKHYIEQGATVVITGRDSERLEKAARSHSGAITVLADVQKVEDLAKLKTVIRDELHGRLDILFANAGIGYFAPIEEVTPDMFDNQFDVNVKGVFFTVQSVLEFMPEGASIILNASAVNAKGSSGGSIYFATKAAVRSFARSLAAELGPRGIRVNALSPGIVRTNFQASSNLDDETADQYVDTVVAQAPLGRAGTPADIAHAAVFLGSDESAYMTASDVVVDGGWMNV
ncbi:MAG: SDR family oxidoreductase [Opitutales bacterium]